METRASPLNPHYASNCPDLKLRRFAPLGVGEVAVGRSGSGAMSNEKLGNRHCYICKAYIPPLVSICWSCGYSQLPAPDGRGGAGKGDIERTKPPGKAGGDLDASRPSSKPDFKSGFRKK